MGQETYKCHCGTEFEDSEFSVMDECLDCRANYATAPQGIGGFTNINDYIRQMTANTMRQDMYQNQQALARYYLNNVEIDTAGTVWNDVPPMYRFTEVADPRPTARIGDTITIRRPAQFDEDATNDLPF